MFARVTGFLRQKDLLVPAAFLITLLIVLSLIIVLGQFFHQSLQTEMAEQFNRQQLLLAQEVAMNIDSFIDHVYRDIHVISQLPEIERIDKSGQCRRIAEAINFSTSNKLLETVRVVDTRGRVLYDSAAPGREGSDLSATGYFQSARLLPRNEKLVTELFDAGTGLESTKKFIIAVPIYRRNADDYSEFRGAVLAVLSLDGLTEKYISPIKSGSRGYAWLIDSDGTLLYHPTQPRMVGKNLYKTDRTCMECHKSFAMEQKMIEGKSATFGYYEAPGGENKLTAYYTFPVAKKSWTVVVSAPYADVIGFMRKSRLFYSLLIVSIFTTALAASGATVVNYKRKIKAEERAKHLENQQRLERELEIQKNYLENIIENTRTNLMVIDKHFSVRTVNTAQARTLGRPASDVVGKHFFTLFPGVLPHYEGIPLKTLFEKTLAGRSFEIRDYKITGLHDGPLYLTMNINPILIDGEIPGILITSSNVTKRVQLEEALKQYTVELEDKVHKGTVTAKQLEQQVMHSEKLAALGRLAAGVAHEINNPLTSISTFAQLLREMATDDFSKNSLDIITNHILRISEIVRQMSTFSRVEQTTTIKAVQVNEVLKAALDLMRFDKRMKSSVTIYTEFDRALPKTMIDEGQLTQVFINIILNAFDALPEGGSLSVKTFRSGDDEGRDSIHAAFADTGTGIPEQELRKIFDPFYTTKEAGKGTGLGLSLSYNIVKRFGGDITVESEVSRGTIFTVIIPIEKER